MGLMLPIHTTIIVALHLPAVSTRRRRVLLRRACYGRKPLLRSASPAEALLACCCGGSFRGRSMRRACYGGFAIVGLGSPAQALAALAAPEPPLIAALGFSCGSRLRLGRQVGGDVPEFALQGQVQQLQQPPPRHQTTRAQRQPQAAKLRPSPGSPRASV